MKKAVTLIAIILLLIPIIPISAEKLEYAGEQCDIPPYFSWQDINGTDYTTPIKDQSPAPTCEAHALCASLETQMQYQMGELYGPDISETHLYFYAGGTYQAGYVNLIDAANYLMEYGVPDEGCYPDPHRAFDYPFESIPGWENRTVKIQEWGWVDHDVESIKSALIKHGPLIICIFFWQDFFYYRGGVYEHRWGSRTGGHVVTIVGYDNSNECWIVKNSWGTDYQEDGWFKIAYGECEMEKKAFYFANVYGQFPIVYVDDDNTMGPWNGTKEHPYQFIQQGINNVYEGYTIYVYNGTYYENVIINKTINLDGENNINTIIDGNGFGHVITISAPNVRVSGFTIQNSGDEPFDSGIKTLTLESCTTIKNNIIHDNAIGIFLNYVAELNSWNIVQDNIIHDNRDGIYSHWSDHNEIKDNIIQNNSGDGIEFVRSRSATITNNTIKNNGECGIYLRGASNNNKIKENIIENSSIGLKLDLSHKNIISKNNFIDNQKQASFYNSFLNRWRRNYWNDWNKIRPKPICGKIYKIPWRNFDLLPKKQPY
ncbi:MAG: right-handed parallel beta-helix repeat-containing protein [Thermoplasmatales archaeon]|nr:right-handed parallel beta-helix repeat-containing protein [Thermoplasmatales archaeon]